MRWQYCIYKEMGAKRTIDYCDAKGPQLVESKTTSEVLRKLGFERWELVSIFSNVPLEPSLIYCFERPATQ